MKKKIVFIIMSFIVIIASVWIVFEFFNVNVNKKTEKDIELLKEYTKEISIRLDEKIKDFPKYSEENEEDLKTFFQEYEEVRKRIKKYSYTNNNNINIKIVRLDQLNEIIVELDEILTDWQKIDLKMKNEYEIVLNILDEGICSVEFISEFNPIFIETVNSINRIRETKRIIPYYEEIEVLTEVIKETKNYIELLDNIVVKNKTDLKVKEATLNVLEIQLKVLEDTYKFSYKLNNSYLNSYKKVLLEKGVRQFSYEITTTNSN